MQEYGQCGERRHVAAAPCFRLAVEVHKKRQCLYQAKSVRIRKFWYFFFSSSFEMYASMVALHANLDHKLIVFEKHTGRQEKSKTRKRTRSQARTSCQPCRDTSCSKGSCCRCGTAMKNAPREFLLAWIAAGQNLHAFDILTKKCTHAPYNLHGTDPLALCVCVCSFMCAGYFSFFVLVVFLVWFPAPPFSNSAAAAGATSQVSTAQEVGSDMQSEVVVSDRQEASESAEVRHSYLAFLFEYLAWSEFICFLTHCTLP